MVLELLILGGVIYYYHQKHKQAKQAKIAAAIEQQSMTQHQSQTPPAYQHPGTLPPAYGVGDFKQPQGQRGGMDGHQTPPYAPQAGFGDEKRPL